jgi:hypothetical protein
VTFATIEPSPVPPAWEISFSTMWQAGVCPKKVGYDRSGGLRILLRPPHLAGLLGNAAHALLRDIGPRRVSSESFDAQWSMRLVRLRSSARRPSIGPLPLPETWPNYWVTYERLRMRLVDDSVSGMDDTGEPSDPRTTEPREATLQLPLVERTLRDPVARIVGAPDLVFEDDQGELCIRDYKTGAKTAPEREAAQLHLYGHLITCVGLEPVWGEIDRLRGAPERQPIRAEMVEAVVDRALKAREAVMAHATDPSTPETCARCAYNTICSESRAGDAAAAKSIYGMVSSTVLSTDGAIAGLRIESESGEVVVGGLGDRTLSIMAGDRVLAVGLKKRSVGAGLMADWATVVVTEEQLTGSLRLGAEGD